MASDYDIHPTYGVPKEDISCPGCGRVYVGKVCLRCEECKKCCACTDPALMDAKAVKEYISEHEKLPPIC